MAEKPLKVQYGFRLFPRAQRVCMRPPIRGGDGSPNATRIWAGLRRSGTTPLGLLAHFLSNPGLRLVRNPGLRFAIPLGLCAPHLNGGASANLRGEGTEN